MSIENEDAWRQPGVRIPSEGRDYGNPPLDEVRRQLGLNLIEATRDYFGDTQAVSLQRDRR